MKKVHLVHVESVLSVSPVGGICSDRQTVASFNILGGIFILHIYNNKQILINLEHDFNLVLKFCEKIKVF